MKTAMVLIFAMAISVFAFATTWAQPFYFTAPMDPFQEVPPVTGSSASGFGCLTLDANSFLHYDVSYVGLLGAETGAHIHGPAPVGVNAGVIFGLPLGTPKIGTIAIPLTLIQITQITAGQWYINVHTTVWPTGEIRGQILQSPIPCTTPVESKTWGAIKDIYNLAP